MSKGQKNADPNIEQIRSLIFGQQMNEYDARFDRMQEQVELLKKDLHSSFGELKRAIESLAERGENNQGEVSRRLDETRKHLDRKLGEVESSLKNMVMQLDNDSTKREQLADYLLALSTQLREGLPAGAVKEKYTNSKND